jgi:hypothetical protein
MKTATANGAILDAAIDRSIVHVRRDDPPPRRAGTGTTALVNVKSLTTARSNTSNQMSTSIHSQ